MDDAIMYSRMHRELEPFSTARVLAVIVSFNPEGEILENIQRLRSQVGSILIIDNGSSAESLQHLRRLNTERAIELLEVGMNMGIGHALNLGVTRATKLGYEWLLTMDQDSQAPSHLVATLVEYFKESVFIF